MNDSYRDVVLNCLRNQNEKIGIVLKNEDRRKQVIWELKGYCGDSPINVSRNTIQFQNGSVILLATMEDSAALIRDLQTIFYDNELGYSEAITNAVGVGSNDQLSEFLNSFKILT